MRLGVVINASIPDAMEESRLGYFALLLSALSSQLRENDLVVVVADYCGDKFGAAFQQINDSWAGKCLAPSLIVRSEDAERLSQDGRPWRLASSRNIGAYALLAGPQGAQRVDGIAFLDADCIPHDGWRERVDLLFSTSIHTHFLVFGRTDHEGPGADDVRVDPRLQFVGTRHGLVINGPVTAAVPQPMVALFERGGGGNMLIGAGLVRELLDSKRDTLFEEEFDGGFGYEETELACAVHNIARWVGYDKDLCVLHKYHPRGPEHTFEIERNRRLFMQKTGLSAFSRSAT